MITEMLFQIRSGALKISELKDHIVKNKPYPTPQNLKVEIRKLVQKFIDNKVLEESVSEYRSRTH